MQIDLRINSVAINSLLPGWKLYNNIPILVLASGQVVRPLEDKFVFYPHKVISGASLQQLTSTNSDFSAIETSVIHDLELVNNRFSPDNHTCIKIDDSLFDINTGMFIEYYRPTELYLRKDNLQISLQKVVDGELENPPTPPYIES